MIPPRPPLLKLSRRAALLGALGVASCARLPALSTEPAVETGAFAMVDGARLPYRIWSPPAGVPVRAVALALHGMADSRDAWEVSAPLFAAGGVALAAPDQRGFGATAERGVWPGTTALVDDAGTMLATLAGRFPGMPLFGVGESMGAAVLMVLDADRPATLGSTSLSGIALAAPAVWSRATMTALLRVGLFAVSHTVPELEMAGGPGQLRASDNNDALRRLSRDRLTLHRTRMDAVRGLVDLMDAAVAAAPHLTPPALLLYGGKDELVPKASTVAAWRLLPAGSRTAFYPGGYHLLLRDKGRAVPIGDVLAWMDNPLAPLPSGADYVAQGWLVAQPDDA